MSDFISGFWSQYIAVLTLAGIAGCMILLWVSGRKKVAARSDNTTGHVWDGDLTEMNNPLPMWWVGLFILTVVFAVGYLVAYPGLGSYAGELKWSTRSEYESEVARATRELEPLYAQFTAKTPEELAGDYFELRGEMLHLPPGQGFSIYSLAALLPLLPAKQRPTHPNDWMSTDAEVACPDPNCPSRFRITRTGTRKFSHAAVTAVPLSGEKRS